MNDPLEDALAAFRAEQDRVRGDPQATRARLLRSARRRDERRKLAAAALVVLGLIATNSTTWAWSTGRLDRVAELFGLAPSPSALAERSQHDPPGSSGVAVRDEGEPSPRVADDVRAVRAAQGDPRGSSGVAVRDEGEPSPRAADDVRALRAARGDPRGSSSVEPIAGAAYGGPRGSSAEPMASARAASVERVQRAAREDARTPPSADERAARATHAAAPPDAHDAPQVEPAAPEGGSLEVALDELARAETSSAVEADRRAFEEAHRLHFAGAPPAAALQAWDDYLSRFPSGRFVPEARFNRAVCLLRAGRDEEARAALEPFAAGAYGGVRTREARRLLDALARGALRR